MSIESERRLMASVARDEKLSQAARYEEVATNSRTRAEKLEPAAGLLAHILKKMNAGEAILLHSADARALLGTGVPSEAAEIMQGAIEETETAAQSGRRSAVDAAQMAQSVLESLGDNATAQADVISIVDDSRLPRSDATLRLNQL